MHVKCFEGEVEAKTEARSMARESERDVVSKQVRMLVLCEMESTRCTTAMKHVNIKS